MSFVLPLQAGSLRPISLLASVVGAHAVSIAIAFRSGPSWHRLLNRRSLSHSARRRLNGPGGLVSLLRGSGVFFNFIECRPFRLSV